MAFGLEQEHKVLMGMVTDIRKGLIQRLEKTVADGGNQQATHGQAGQLVGLLNQRQRNLAVVPHNMTSEIQMHLAQGTITPYIDKIIRNRWSKFLLSFETILLSFCLTFKKLLPK